jgi:hypothetical protein
MIYIIKYKYSRYEYLLSADLPADLVIVADVASVEQVDLRK